MPPNTPHNTSRDRAALNSTGLAPRLIELVAACFTGRWIENHEPDEAIREISTLARSEHWRLATWDCDAGLTLPAADTPAPVPQDTTDPLAVIRGASQLSQGSTTTLPVLRNFHRCLASTEIIQAIERQVSQGKHTRTFLVVLAPVTQIPAELEKLFTVIDHELPDHAQLDGIARGVATQDGELPEGDELGRG